MTAAQTLEVVYGLFQNMRVVVDDGKASADNVRNVLEIIQEMANETNKSKRDKLQQDIRSWLSPPDPSKNHNLARESRHTGSATWFVEGGTFSEWKMSSSGSLLWVHGKPGAGKSVLCSTIIEDVESMRKSGLASLAFFYCDFREDKKKRLGGLLSSVLAQLCHQSDSYCQILSSFYSKHDNGSKLPSDDELIQLLKDILKVPGQAPVYLIVDGLDECSNTPDTPSPREKVLMLFEDLVNLRLPNLRICITSRPEFDIRVALEPLIFRSVSLHDEGEQRKDIEDYIRSVVNTDPKMRRWKVADKELVIYVLIKKSDGMFRWVYCQIDYLRRCLPGRIRRALDELPETLDATYDRALREIDKADWEVSYRLLQCVAVAFRPLHVKELAEILSFDFKTRPIPKFHEGWRLRDPVDAVLSTTSGLLAIVDNQGSRVIQFSHFSVKEYLTASRLAETNDIISRYHISLKLAHTLTAQACLGILLHLDENMVSRDNLEEYPLAEYAAEHWMDHARFEGVSENVEDGMKRLFDPSKRHLEICLWVYDPISTRQTRQAEMLFHHRIFPLHYAAYCGLHFIVKLLVVEHLQDVDSPYFGDKSTPLHQASRQGHEDIVQLLLEHDADVTAQDNNGESPLHLASSHGHEKVALLLLEQGADLTTQDKHGRTPLHWASSFGHEKVVLLLLEHGADSATQDQDGCSSIYLASQLRHEKVTLLLLKYGADLTAQDEDGWNILHLASLHGDEKTALLLLKHGADLTAQDKHGRTPLHLASVQGHEKFTRLLLEHGADLTAQEEHGWTPFHLALEAGNEKGALLLLEHGTDLTAQDKFGRTPLHVASVHGSEKVALLLLEHGADLTAQDNYGWSPLHLASQAGHEKVALLFMEHGADLTAQDKFGWISLHLASMHGHEKVALLLLEQGADATAQNKHGRTPLHQASFHGHEKVALLLLEHGADLTAQDKDRRSPLHLASHCGHEKVALLLLEHGADLTAQDKNRRTPLHLASSHGRDKVALLLLEHGADLTAHINGGWTSLHVAVRCGRTKVAHLFLDHGADVTAQQKDGSTLLHLASRWGHVNVARLIFDHGVDPTTLNNHGWNALHLASRWGHVKVARFLLDHGADPTVQNKYGWTPLRLALRGGHVEVARLFGEHGADTTGRDEQVAPPSHVAPDQEDLGLVRMFERDADASHASDRKTAWSSIIGFITIIIVACYIFCARANLRK